MAEHKNKDEEYNLPIFHGNEWSKWKFRLTLYLESKGVKSILTEAIPTEEQQKTEWQKKDLKARNIIVQGLSNSQLELLLNEKTAKAMIDKLDSIYKPSSTTLRLLAKRKLLDLKMKENDDPTEFITKFE